MTTSDKSKEPSFRCPHCAEDDLVDSGTGLVCEGCQASYPRLGPVPILVPDPAAYCAIYRQSLLATLFEAGHTDREALAQVQQFAAQAPGLEPQRFGDDWVGRERRRESSLEALHPAASEALQGFHSELSEHPFEKRVLDILPAGELGAVLEIGCGSGLMTGLLRPRASALWAADLSLRAVLVSTEEADPGGENANSGGEKATPVVLDAHALPFAEGSLDLVVALNLIDLLDEPMAFLAEVERVLRPGGRLLLTSPDPGLGQEAEILVPMIEEAGLRLERAEDGLEWVRDHGPRQLQLYLCQLLVALKPID